MCIVILHSILGRLDLHFRKWMSHCADEFSQIKETQRQMAKMLEDEAAAMQTEMRVIKEEEKARLLLEALTQPIWLKSDTHTQLWDFERRVDLDVSFKKYWFYASVRFKQRPWCIV